MSTYEWYIIQVGRLYLIGKPYDDSDLIRFSQSVWDGCRFKNFDTAIRVARRFDGRVIRFNSITGRTEGGWK